MNRLFSDLFRKFEGIILGVFGTIWGCMDRFWEGKARACWDFLRRGLGDVLKDVRDVVIDLNDVVIDI